MEDVYDSELKGLDVMIDDVPNQKGFQGSSGIDYSLGGSKLQKQVMPPYSVFWRHLVQDVRLLIQKLKFF